MCPEWALICQRWRVNAWALDLEMGRVREQRARTEIVVSLLLLRRRRGQRLQPWGSGGCTPAHISAWLASCCETKCGGVQMREQKEKLFRCGWKMCLFTAWQVKSRLRPAAWLTRPPPKDKTQTRHGLKNIA